MRRFLVLAALAGGLAFVALRSSPRPTTPPARVATAPTPTRASPPPRPPRPAVVAIAPPAALDRPRHAAEVPAFLDALEASARARGAVSAQEVEPGLAAIQELLGPDPEALAAFADRMARLSSTLDDRAFTGDVEVSPDAPPPLTP